MGARPIDTVIVTSCIYEIHHSNSLPLSSAFWINISSHSWEFFDQPFPSRQQSTGPSRISDLGSQKGCDTPLSPSHAGDKGAYTHVTFFKKKVNQKTVGLRLVDTVVLPRPSAIEEGKAAVSAPSKRPFCLLTKGSTKNNTSNALQKEVE